jgi:hypothetical protein
MNGIIDKARHGLRPCVRPRLLPADFYDVQFSIVTFSMTIGRLRERSSARDVA